MRATLLIFSVLCNIFFSNGRLVERSTASAVTDTIQNPRRVKKEVYEEETLAAFSKEDDGCTDEFAHTTQERKPRHYIFPENSYTTKYLTRIMRSSQEVLPKNNNKTSEVVISAKKDKSELVKKPIPKFSEIDYYDDFQENVMRSPIKFLESTDHEDEDFNVDDYDFDFNHDEYSGRGKHLEPRVRNLGEIKQFVAPMQKIQSKLNKPVVQNQPEQRVKIGQNIKKSNLKKGRNVDFYDDLNKTTSKIETKTKVYDDFDDVDESKEKPPRHVRSSWQEPGQTLPMFPESPTKKVADGENSISEEQTTYKLYWF